MEGEGVSHEREVRRNLLNAFDEGSQWVRERYGVGGEPPRRRFLRWGYNGYNIVDGTIILDVDIFDATVNNPSGQLVVHYGPYDVELAATQYYEGIGVEETLHWMQAKRLGVDRGVFRAWLAPLSVSTDPLTYWSQPHEWQAILRQGEFFRHKYGENPLAPFERYVRFYLNKRGSSTADWE